VSGRAVVIGSVGLDLVAASPGALSAVAAAGNSGSNIAIRLAAAGWQVTFVTVVGADDAGRLVKADCERWGVATHSFLIDADYPTPRVFIVSDGTAASRLLFTCPGCGGRAEPLRIPRADQLGPRAVADAAAADLVIADIPGPAAARLAGAGRNGLVWYEASMFEAGTADQRALAAHADVLKCSREEAGHYTALFAAPGPRARVKIVTAGAAGVDAELRADAAPARAITPGNDAAACAQGGQSPPGWQRLHVAAAPARLVDPLGAGDAFTVAAAASLAFVRGPGPALTAGGLKTAMTAGAAAAATACGAVGARGDMTNIAAGTANPWIADDLPFRCPRCSP
jgi:sugar/nucleoside kinase (ribokinase family)